MVSETEIAKKVITYLSDLKWDIYQEVEFGIGNSLGSGSRADIVAVQNGIVWIIEVKTCFSLALLEQAYHWLGKANYVSIAAPGNIKWFFEKICKDYGIGVIGDGQERLAPRLYRRVAKDLRSKLCDQHKTYAEAGNNSCHYWSPFKRTCANILNYVKYHEGCGIGEIIKNCDTHYATLATARSAILTWIKANLVPGIIAIKDGKRYKFYLGNYCLRCAIIFRSNEILRFCEKCQLMENV